MQLLTKGDIVNVSSFTGLVIRHIKEISIFIQTTSTESIFLYCTTNIQYKSEAAGAGRYFRRIFLPIYFLILLSNGIIIISSIKRKIKLHHSDREGESICFSII